MKVCLTASNGELYTMKKKYTLFLSIFIIELFIVSILNEINVRIQSWIGNAIGTFIFLLPIQILLFMLSRDEKFSEKKRILFKIIFWFINICYLSGGIALITQI